MNQKGLWARRHDACHVPWRIFDLVLARLAAFEKRSLSREMLNPNPCNFIKRMELDFLYVKIIMDL